MPDLSIRLVTFPNRYLMGAAFARIQDHYESPELRGRIFTLEDFLDAHAKPDGSFEFFGQWDGYNVPSRALQPFRDGRFDPLMRKERVLLDLVKDEAEPFYLIAVQRGSEQAAAHEVVHALYDLDRDYQTLVLRELPRFDLPNLRKTLLCMGYDRGVLDDGLNAYLCAGVPGKTADADFDRAILEMRRLFRGHFGFCPHTKRGLKNLLLMTRTQDFPWPPPSEP